MNFTAMIIAMLLGSAAGLFFWFHPDAALKRKIYPWYVALFAVLFSGLVLFQGGMSLAPVLIPVVALVSWLNFRKTRFCDQCGRMSAPRNAFRPDDFCRRCGAPLNKVLENRDKERIGTFR